MAVLIRIALLLLMCGASACTFLDDDAVLGLDPDRLAMIALFEADSTSTVVVVGYPHRSDGEGPDAVIRAGFTGSILPGTREPCDTAIDATYGAYSCYRVTYPRPLHPGDTLHLTADAGSASVAGITVLPDRPQVLQPAGDTIVARRTGDLIVLPIELAASRAASVDIVIDNPRVTVDNQIRHDCLFLSTQFNGTINDTIRIRGLTCPGERTPDWEQIEFDVRWLANDSAYTNYRRSAGGDIIPLPWPDLGMVEGAGMVGSRTSSSALRVTIR